MKLPTILFIILLGAVGLYLLFGNDETVTPEKERGDTPITPPRQSFQPRSRQLPGQPRTQPAPAWHSDQTSLFPGEPVTGAPAAGNYRFRPREGEEKTIGQDGPSYAFPLSPGQTTPYAPTSPAGAGYRFRPDDSTRGKKRWTGNYR